MERAELIALGNPGSPIAEAYRNVRSAIRTAGDNLKIIEITGVAPDTEKSVFTANLAVVLAQAGKKILLMDCDSANPTQHTLFQRDNRGLSEAAASGKSHIDRSGKGKRPAGMTEVAVRVEVMPQVEFVSHGDVARVLHQPDRIRAETHPHRAPPRHVA